MTHWNRHSAARSHYGRPISRRLRRPGQRERRAGILPVAGKILSAPFRGLWELYLKLSDPPVPPPPDDSPAAGGPGGRGRPSAAMGLGERPLSGRGAADCAGEGARGFGEDPGGGDAADRSVPPLRPGAAAARDAKASRARKGAKVRIGLAALVLAGLAAAAFLLAPGLFERPLPPEAAGASAAVGDGVALVASGQGFQEGPDSEAPAAPQTAAAPAASAGGGAFAPDSGRAIFAPDGPGGVPGESAAAPASAARPAVGRGDPLPAEPALQEGLFSTESRVRASSPSMSRTVSEGGTLTQALDSLGLTQGEATLALEALTREGALAELRQGGTVTVVRAPEHKGGGVERVEFQGPGQVRPVSLVPGGPNGFVYFSSAAPSLDLQIAFRGTVREGGGFLDAFADAGLSPDAASELADLLSSQVDFLSDVRAGDSFQLLYRSSWEEERLMDDPTLLMVSVVNLDRKLEFFRRDGRRGSANFYDMEFRSVKKPFRASPLQYNLVAPVYPDAGSRAIPKSESGGNVRFGAPQGVPVASVAGGTVKFAGRRGGFGNLVVVSHDDGGYETFYAHLSGFAPGVEAGARVAEGQPIGKVGMTGATFSPVLDYRLYRGGQSLDLRREISELRGDMLDVDLRADFAELVGRRRVALHNLLALEAL